MGPGLDIVTEAPVTGMGGRRGIVSDIGLLFDPLPEGSKTVNKRDKRPTVEVPNFFCRLRWRIFFKAYPTVVKKTPDPGGQKLSIKELYLALNGGI